MRCLTLIFLLSVVCCTAQNRTLDTIIEEYHKSQENEQTQWEWPNLTEDYRDQKLAKYTNWLSQLDKIDVSTLDTQGSINYDLLQLIFQNNVDNINYGTHLFPLSAEGGFIISMIYKLKGTKIESAEELSNYNKLLSQLPDYLEAQTSLLKEGLRQNKVMPKLVVRNCKSILDNQIENKVEFLKSPISHLHMSIGTSEKTESLINEAVTPAFEKLSSFLSEYESQTHEEVGFSYCTDGKTFYEERVRYFTTLDMTPQDIFDKGQEEVKRIRAEMNDIIVELGFMGTFEEFIHFLRTDPQFYAETPQELLNHAAWLSMKAQEILPQYFSTLPSLPFTVNPVPEAIAPTYTTGRYSGGSFDSRKAGEYWVNTYNLPARPLYVLPSLTLHEAVPGHHLQISLANNLEGIPKFRKNQYLSAFGEGWGLYAEYLGKEAGIYKTLYEDFGRLTYEMWRACRLVVDPGIHYFGWTREQAIDFMAKNTSLSLHEVNTEIDRYIGWPGQAVSYKIGELTIKRLRQKSEEELQDKFDIREFHKVILSNGSVPLSTLERIVLEYIDGKKE